MHGTLTVDASSSGQRLDRVLPPRVQMSRSRIQKQIADGTVTVNAKNVTPHYAVKEGDVVAWSFEEEESIHIVPNADLAVSVVHEDDDKIVIDKTAGMVVHQGTGHKDPDTIANWFLAHVPDGREIGDDPLRPGIVHRLDRDVSGVMVLAKTKECFAELTRQFAEGSVEKQYTAVVYGIPEQPAGTLTFRLARSKTKSGKVAALPLSEKEDGREATTNFEVVRVQKHHALVTMRPTTGRMHQIRAHLAAINHAIVGDTLYAPRLFQPERAERLFLHAIEIAFQGKEKRETYTSPLPAIFETFLNTHA